MNESDYFAVSVVIPTLGRRNLGRTVDHLNCGSVVPAEILICIPEEDAHRAESISAPNVKVVKCPSRGQVLQRIIGFQSSVNPVVLQLDDDVFLREKCLERMINAISVDVPVAIGPKFHDATTGGYRSFLVSDQGFHPCLERILFWIINGPKGFQPGAIGISGVNMGIPESPENWENVEWLPGGCVLHRRENLVLFNYYPFGGKATAEDLYHSQVLRKKGVKLVRCGLAVCDVDFSSSSLKPFRFLSEYFEYAKRMTILSKSKDGNLGRLYCYLIVNLIRILCRKLVR